jgi:hypothetical protein
MHIILTMNKIKDWIGSNDMSYRIRPSSSVPRGLNNEDIISSLGDWVCTVALYLDM